jgi:hypothetical protein
MKLKKPIHASVTGDRVLDMVGRDENEGICLTCGADAEGVEPDARQYKCTACGDLRVYGAQEIVLMGAYHMEPITQSETP